METKRIILNETSYFGPGSRFILADEIKSRNFRKAFLITDKDLVRFGISEKITCILSNNSIPYEVFSDIKQNPTVQNVADALDAFKKSGADVIIALGGGSSIDTAKAVGIISNNQEFENVISLEGIADTKNRSIPVIALPTTAGTAAEVTINYVITDDKSIKKMVCVDPKDIPTVAIVDAELMASMPASLTAATGMDALTHAIEGFITKGAWEMTDMFELKAIEIISRTLPKAVTNGNDMAARNGMALAQYIAGMGFSNVGLGLVHGMAHPLGAYFDIPHGVANALLLPYVMQYNMDSSVEKYGKIAEAMGVETSGMNEMEKAQAAVDAVRNLAIQIGIPQKLSSLGVTEDSIDKLAESALADVCTPGNPKEASLEDIRTLYIQAL